MIRLGVLLILLAAALAVWADHQWTKLEINETASEDKAITVFEHALMICLKGGVVAGAVGLSLILCGVVALTGLPAY